MIWKLAVTSRNIQLKSNKFPFKLNRIWNINMECRHPPRLLLVKTCILVSRKFIYFKIQNFNNTTAYRNIWTCYIHLVETHYILWLNNSCINLSLHCSFFVVIGKVCFGWVFILVSLFTVLRNKIEFHVNSFY